MKIRRKTKICLNCDASLNEVYNYCPKCGQENNDNNVSLKTLIGDFFNTYLAIDSRFGRSFKPFFTKPGDLTVKYTSGKRVSYAHPVRFYLIVSVFYFFTVTIAANYLNDDDDSIVNTPDYSQTLDGIDGLADTTKVQLLSALSSNQKKALNNEITSGELENLKDLESFISELDTSRQYKLRAAIGTTAADSLGLLAESDNQKQIDDSDTEKALDVEGGEGLEIDIGDENDLIIERVDFSLIKRLDKEYGDDIKDEQIYDSLNLGELDAIDDLLVRQSIRVTRADSEQILTFVVKNLPLMMLVLIPIFGLVLKLFYIRRNQLYIKHVVHALHLHTYAYLVYGAFILLTVYLISHEDLQPILNILAFFIVSIYAYLSFKRVYQQHWFKTLVKFLLIGMIYLSSITFFFLVEMVISLLLY